MRSGPPGTGPGRALPGKGGHREGGYASRHGKADDQRQDQRPHPAARRLVPSSWRRLTVPVVKKRRTARRRRQEETAACSSRWRSSSNGLPGRPELAFPGRRLSRAPAAVVRVAGSTRARTGRRGTCPEAAPAAAPAPPPPAPSAAPAPRSAFDPSEAGPEPSDARPEPSEVRVGPCAASGLNARMIESGSQSRSAGGLRRRRAARRRWAVAGVLGEAALHQRPHLGRDLIQAGAAMHHAVQQRGRGPGADGPGRSRRRQAPRPG